MNIALDELSEAGSDQATITTDEGLRQEVQALYAQKGLPEMTTKYSKYLVKNCGVSTEGQ